MSNIGSTGEIEEKICNHMVTLPRTGQKLLDLGHNNFLEKLSIFYQNSYKLCMFIECRCLRFLNFYILLYARIILFFVIKFCDFIFVGKKACYHLYWFSNQDYLPIWKEEALRRTCPVHNKSSWRTNWRKKFLFWYNPYR